VDCISLCHMLKAQHCYLCLIIVLICIRHHTRPQLSTPATCDIAVFVSKSSSAEVACGTSYVHINVSYLCDWTVHTVNLAWLYYNTRDLQGLQYFKLVLISLNTDGVKIADFFNLGQNTVYE